ncbi:MAG: hypothetical protein ACKOGN_09295 [Gammaproteobacteria bacterium]
MRTREFLITWQTFAVAAIPGMAGSVWATLRLTPIMEGVDLAEWVLLASLLTVVLSISQFGIKPGYMQEVADRGKEARYAALRVSLLLMGTTGFLAGSAVAIALFFLWRLDYWHNIAVLVWLPIYGMFANLGMMLHTDLRALGGARVLAVVAGVTFPLFAVLMELTLRADINPLAAFFAAQCTTSLITIGYLGHRAGVMQHAGLDKQFLRRALLIGLPVMGGLLAKYVADLTVSATFRWSADATVAGSFGLAVRATEPLMSLFIGAFQMAWGATIYQWIKQSADGAIVRRYSAHSWWLVVAGIPLGIVIAAPILFYAKANGVTTLDCLFVGMMISRLLAFGMASTMGFGQTLQRNYQVGMRLLLAEMVVSISALPLLAIASTPWAIVAAAVIPWWFVMRLRSHSNRVVETLVTN